jgi:hypothetical protein
MKRNLIGTLSLVAMSLLLTATGAHAQSPVQTYVPFAFNVGTTQLPAGTYKIKKAEFDSNYLIIRNVKTGTTTVSLFQPEYSRNVRDKLVFYRFGNQHFLAEIWGGAHSTGMTFPDSKKIERKLQVASGPSNAGEEVEIALK